MCITCEINQKQSEEFAFKMMEILNHGSLAIMISIGHRTGLFDIMKGMPESSSEEIAKAAKLNERYVREWLGAMVVGRVITTNEKGNLFQLPLEHSQFLTRGSESGNLAIYTQYLSVVSSVEERILDCFKNGGGVDYAHYHRFHEVMAEDSEQTVLGSLVQDILPLVPNGMENLGKGINVLDIGCGSGKALLLLAKKFPKSTFVGYDFCIEPIEAAQKEVQFLGLSNITFKQVDLTTYKPKEKFDLITAFDAIHDQARPDLVLKSIYNSLNDKGCFLMQDIDSSENVFNNINLPLGPMLYTSSCMHCMPVSLAQNGLGLGAMWGTEMANRLLNESGFSQVTESRLNHDFQNCYFVALK